LLGFHRRRTAGMEDQSAAVRNKKHDLPASTIEAVEDAIVTDRQELGRVIARSTFSQEAVIAAADEARRRLGRELPPPPQKLSNRPPRRRPTSRF
jgi:hypothetical protein